VEASATGEGEWGAVRGNGCEQATGGRKGKGESGLSLSAAEDGVRAEFGVAQKLEQ